VTSLKVAGAPITWGVCEVRGWGLQLDPDRVLGEMARIGLAATELGPKGFLPSDPPKLRDLLGAHGLQLVGGFVPVVLHEWDRLEERLGRVAAAADLLAGGGSKVLVLAAAFPKRGYDTSPELDGDAWVRLLRGIDRVVEIAGERGLTVALHPHYGTAIERPEHVERVLEDSDVPLCLDTGHLMVGGADPLEVARRAGERVAHVHLKDVAAGLADQVRAGLLGYRDAVAEGLYRPLGEGDLDVPAIVRALRDAGFEGWYVLEQDTVLKEVPGEGAGPVRDAGASLELLRRVAEELDHGNPASGGRGGAGARDAASRVRRVG
jgi:inosose dehydratase